MKHEQEKNHTGMIIHVIPKLYYPLFSGIGYELLSHKYTAHGKILIVHS